jgi:hypothetical protein
MNKSNSQSGNTLIIILIAVAMFASLTYAFTQGSRTSSSALTSEQSRMAAQEIIAYGETIKSGFQKLRLRGVAIDGVSFYNTQYLYYDGTLVSPQAQYPKCTTNECMMFHKDGANINPVILPSSYFIDPPSPASGIKYGVWYDRVPNMDGIGTNAKDGVYILSGLQKEICIKINDILGIINSSGNPPKFTPNGSSAYPTDLYAASIPFSGGIVTNTADYCWENQTGINSYIITFLVR